MRTVLLLVALLILSVPLAEAPALASAARQATPPPISESPTPADCRVAPRPAPSLAGTPNPGDPALREQIAATPLPDAALPVGRPAEAATVAGIDATLRELVACLRAGDRARVLSFFADDVPPARLHLLGFYDIYAFPDWAPTPGVGAGTTVPVPTEVLALDDGRAVAVYHVPNAEAALLVFFVARDDRWLVAEAVETALPATPAAGGRPTAVGVADVGPPAPRVERGDGVAGVVVPEAQADAFYLAFFGESAAGYWTPTEADVLALEAVLPTAVRDATRETATATFGRIDPDLWQRLPDYGRQYIGPVEGGERRIFVNLFCDDLGIDWQTEPVAVDDGGGCFLQATADPATGAILRIRVNGEA